jgi:hypothetical protein
MNIRVLAVFALLLPAPAQARDFTSTVTESDQITRLRPEFQVPDEPNQLFYIERSVNANTVVYAARMDGDGHLDARAPVDVFWRWFNIDGHKKPLNFIERMMAYGVHATGTAPPVHFSIVPLPEREMTLALDANRKPQALMKIGGHTVRVVYVYLEVIDGLIPKVPSLDIFGIDTASGKAIREHLVQR